MTKKVEGKDKRDNTVTSVKKCTTVTPLRYFIEA